MRGPYDDTVLSYFYKVSNLCGLDYRTGTYVHMVAYLDRVVVAIEESKLIDDVFLLRGGEKELTTLWRIEYID